MTQPSPPFYHLIVYVPTDAAARVRETLATSGAGALGNYDSCSFSCRGTGRYRGNERSHPAIGERGVLTEVPEERIEVVVPNDSTTLHTVLREVKRVHPYEEPAIHLLPMWDYKDLL